MDSLDAVDLTLAVEQRFGLSGDKVPATLGEFRGAGGGHPGECAPPPPAGWFEPVDDEPLTIPGETVAAAFLNQAMARRRMVVAADDIAGGITYERLVIGASAMAARFRTIAVPNVGLMLPASVACDLSFLGLHLAGKLPVVLNWTTGPANLAHAVKLAGLTHVVTSKAFVDRVHVDVPGARLLFLEELRGRIGKIELLRRLIAVRWVGGWFKNRLLKPPRATRTFSCVLLFTSGSEKRAQAPCR